MKKKILLACYLLILFTFSMALVPEVYAVGTPAKGYALIQPCPSTGCGFTEFIALVNRFINLLLYFAFILAIISFIYAGFLLIFSGGSESKLQDAKGIFGKVVMGIILAFLAWTIVHFILGLFGVSDSYTLL